jgi:peptide deformylase
MLSIVSSSEPLLQTVSEAVFLHEIKDIQGLIDEMFAIARGERGDEKGRKMVGLAAPQVGWAKKVILVDLGVERSRNELGELKAYLNPRISWRSEEEGLDREGCYSADPQLVGLVKRAQKVKISAWDRFGNPIEEEFSGFTARIFQHEIDHLEGIRFPDRVGENGKRGVLHWVKADEWDKYKQDPLNWPTLCSWDEWLAMKSGKK